MVERKGSLLVPSEAATNRVSSDSALFNLYSDESVHNDGGHSTARLSSRLKRRSLSNRSSDNEELEDFRSQQGPSHSAQSSVDLNSAGLQHMRNSSGSSPQRANFPPRSSSTQHDSIARPFSTHSRASSASINDYYDPYSQDIASAELDSEYDTKYGPDLLSVPTLFDQEVHVFPPARSPSQRKWDAHADKGNGHISFNDDEETLQVPSPVSRRRSIMETAARELRRMSIRVVNAAQQDHSKSPIVPLPDEIHEVEVIDHVDYRGRAHEEVTQPAQSLGMALTGRTLGMFGPKNPFRRAAHAMLLNPFTEPFILALIIANVVILTIQAAPDVFEHPRPTGTGYFHTWEDWALFSLMVIFTLEIILRSIVSGFAFNSRTLFFTHRSDDDAANEALTWNAVKGAVKQTAVALGRSQTLKKPAKHVKLPSLAQRDGSAFARVATFNDIPFQLSVLQQHETTASQTAYLRHSFNRIDLLAVACFWIAFGLAVLGLESKNWLFIFRGLSVLRAARLLTLTAGTMTILQSLKRAGPMLVNVAFFVVFAMVLFSVIGVQSFKGSYSRSCLWIDPANVQNYSTGYQCGGFLDAANNRASFLTADGLSSGVDVKGYVCPRGQLCIEGQNPYNGTESFDNFASALMQVVIVASCNGWSTVMYNMMAADYFVSCLFFIICLIVLNFWLINMFVAVITNTFQSIVEDTKHSAFASNQLGASASQQQLDSDTDRRKRRRELYQRIIGRSRLFWVALVLADVTVQATRNNSMSGNYANTLTQIERYFTIAFDIEIALRFLAALPAWREFFGSAQNNADLLLAFSTTLIQIPPIHNSSVYPWLTAFQLARFYRVMLAIPRTRRLLARITGSIAGLINMILFLFLMNFVATLFSIQFLRGELPAEIEGQSVQMSFYQIYNGFLGVYQVLTSENWTTVLYSATGSSYNTFNIVLAAVFFSGWFLFANFIMVQMFIAVINEGFALSEQDKQQQQMDRYLGRTEMKMPAAIRLLDKYNPYRHVKPKSQRVHEAEQPYVPQLQRKTTVRDIITGGMIDLRRSPTIRLQQAASPFRQLLGVKSKDDLKGANSPLQAMDETADEGLFDPRQNIALLTARPGQIDEGAKLVHERQLAEISFIREHPSYDRSLWIFPQNNWFRQFLQTCVASSYGQRIYGAQPIKYRRITFSLLVLAAVVGSIAVAALATPVYRQSYYIQNGDIRLTWFNLTEVSLGMLFILEFLVKVIADGFLWAPNAYMLSIWNGLDFMVMLSLIVNVTTALISGGGISRATRALKALRALRLINFLERTRHTFYDVLISGAGKLFDACILAILYIIPYAVWGQNIFTGLFLYCNDGNATNKLQCVGEYTSSPLQWDFLAPRGWINPYVWSFDAFHNSFLILFEIISLEGWINVLQSAMDVVGKDQQPQPNAGQFNSIFFVIYILVGGIFILALFVSIIISTFHGRSGLALLTAEQRQWIDLRKLIMRQRPSRRPRFRPLSLLRSWCFDRAVQKHGWWSRMMTGLYVLHIILLTTQANSDSVTEVNVRDVIFLLFTCVYAADIIIKLAGIGWLSFSKNWWNLYDVVAVTGTFATTIPILLDATSDNALQLQKLFLVSIAFKLVQKNNSLNQLFKTAMGSLPAIGNLFLLWGTLFIVWSIAGMEIFSLTRWQANETFNANFSSFGKALVLLVFCSTGEGWNSFMHDFTVAPPLCSPSHNYLFSDCGSPSWAFGLFISWNIISMYIFANMFTGVVVENFSYVYQLYGRVKSINREEMRAFKKAWAELDLNRTGYLRRRQFVPFFSRLTGPFDVKIYPDALRLSSLMQSCKAEYTVNQENSANIIDGIDIRRLRAATAQMDVTEIRQRRVRYNMLYHEALLSEEQGRGISFTNMLLLLAQYKLIEIDALSVEERFRRKKKLDQVEDLVGLDRVRSLLRTLHYRRVWAEHRGSLNDQFYSRNSNAAQAERQPPPAVPHITIQETQDSPRLLSPLNVDLPRRSLESDEAPHSPSSPSHWARIN